MTENLKKLGISVTLIERLDQVTPSMDNNMATYVENYLKSKNISVILRDSVVELIGDETQVNKVILKNGKVLETDFIIMSIGVKPNVSLARETGIEIIRE